jgi:two-component system, chemotaxis family, protein-glutamate methylesterase/glutaminase
MNQIRVLIIDDSAVVRKALTDILESDPQIRVIATASDPFLAAQKLAEEAPDVITLDVEMPRMDGLTFLQKLMSQHPLPVVMLSSLTESGCETTLKALEYGAVDILTKPQMGVKQFIEESKVTICDAVKAAAQAKVKKLELQKKAPPIQRLPQLNRDLSTSHRPSGQEKLTADVMIEKASTSMIMTTEKIILVGASTGGTEALKTFLSMLPSDAPGMVIVQHMPEKFTASFAQRLNDICAVEVKEAQDGDGVFQGRILIAPGGKHTLLKRSGARYLVEVKDGPLVCRHKPSVDVLFRSGARYAGKNAIGVILTGMGDDGSRGLLEMKEQGAFTFAQDEESCVVYGMPQEAVKIGAVHKSVHLEKMAASVLEQLKK